MGKGEKKLGKCSASLQMDGDKCNVRRGAGLEGLGVDPRSLAVDMYLWDR